jgi:hypothetical protein
MQSQINLTYVTNENDINTNATYVAEFEGTSYFGKFIDASVGTFYKAKHFIWNGSVFPQGIPFEALTSVAVVA